MRNTTSQFPYSVDDRIYFQNMSLEQLNIKNQFDTEFDAGQYTNASNVLNNANIDFFGASVFNLIENRLIALETYLLTLQKPHHQAYQPAEPTGVPEGFSWIV